MSETPQQRGRPRKHASNAARARAYRTSHDLQKVTVDVPTRYIQEFRAFAHWLRNLRRFDAHYVAPEVSHDEQAYERWSRQLERTRVAFEHDQVLPPIFPFEGPTKALGNERRTEFTWKRSSKAKANKVLIRLSHPSLMANGTIEPSDWGLEQRWLWEVRGKDEIFGAHCYGWVNNLGVAMVMTELMLRLCAEDNRRV